MKTISGFDQVILGADPAQPRVKGKSISIAQIMVILSELQDILNGLNINTVTELLAAVESLQLHSTNPTIHVTEQFKTLLTEIVLAYQAGTLGSGSGEITGGGAIVFDSVASMLSTQGTVGSIGIITTEPLNQYMWSTTEGRWTVKDGNVYEDIDDLPSDTSFYIPSGTELILSSTGVRYTWSTAQPQSVINTYPEIISTTIDNTGTVLTIGLSIVGYNGIAYTDDCFSLTGSLSGADIGVTYVSGDGTTTRVYTIDAVISAAETVTVIYIGGENVIESIDGGDMASVTIILDPTDNGSEVLPPEPVYNNLTWLCQDTALPVVCSESTTYNGTMTGLSGTATPQVFNSNPLYTLRDYGFNISASATSLKIPVILPTGESMTNFELSAGFFFTMQSWYNTSPWILFHVTDGTHTIQLRWWWGTSSLELVVNGSVITPSTSNSIAFNCSEFQRQYMSMRVVNGVVTVTYTKLVTEDVYGTGRSTEVFDTTVATWTLVSEVIFTDPSLYFASYEGTTPPPYHNITVGTCTWERITE